MQILVLDYTAVNLLKVALTSFPSSPTRPMESASPREYRRTRTAADTWPHILPRYKQIVEVNLQHLHSTCFLWQWVRISTKNTLFIPPKKNRSLSTEEVKVR